MPKSSMLPDIGPFKPSAKTKMLNRIKEQRNPNLLLNWIFISALILLALNDHFFKWEFSNLITGKLSDFAGLLILPMFLQFIFPRLKVHAFIVSALFFMFWKLPISQGFINFYNRYAFITITRTVDYTDIVALSILPLSFYLTRHIDYYRLFKNNRLAINPSIVLIPACFVFMATSPPDSYFMQPNGDIHIGKAFNLKMDPEEALEKLKEHGFVVKVDTIPSDRIIGESYILQDVVLKKGVDTLESIQFSFRGHKILVNNVTLNRSFKTSDWRQLKQLSRHYRRLIKSGIVEEIK